MKLSDEEYMEKILSDADRISRAFGEVAGLSNDDVNQALIFLTVKSRPLIDGDLNSGVSEDELDRILDWMVMLRTNCYLAEAVFAGVAAPVHKDEHDEIHFSSVPAK